MVNDSANDLDGFYSLKIAGIIQETQDARSFVLDVPENLANTFRYAAGQFLTFKIRIDNIMLLRAYSLSSAPSIDGRPKFTVKRVKDGRVSNLFNDTIRLGQYLHCRPPDGRFVLSPNKNNPILGLADGSGITPIISLAKEILYNFERKFTLFYANRDRCSVIFQQELNALKRRFKNRFNILYHFDDISGYLTRETIDPVMSAHHEYELFICGPTPFMDIIQSSAADAHIMRKQIHVERFISLPDSDHLSNNQQEKEPISEVGGVFMLTLDGQEHHVVMKPGKTLLESALDAGLRPSYSCREGGCATCLARLIKGQVSMKSTQALSQEDVAAGWILTCQARPSSTEEIIIDYDADY